MTKLAQLRVLRSRLAKIEGDRAAYLAKAPKESDRVDREAASHALTYVVHYLDSVGAQADALRRLLVELHDKSAGNKGTDISDTIRGKIAGVVHLRAMYFEGGATRKAAKWVVRNLPENLKMYLSPNGSVTDRTVYEWYAKWGGPHGEKGAGREGYRFMLKAGLKAPGKAPGERALKNVLASLARSPGVQ